MTGWTAANRRHAGSMLRFGRHPAAAVYESLGARPWAALAPGWLNLGLWTGGGDEAEAPTAVRRLVSTLARDLPRDAIVLDAGCGLGVQDAVIAETARPRHLVALNITLSQLVHGERELNASGASPLCADACRIPLRSDSVDGLISVEAAFHFSSRAAFFAEAARVLRPGGVLSMSDVSAERLPRTPGEALAGAANLRFWGIRRRAVSSASEIAGLLEAAGFRDVEVESCGARVIPPAVRALQRRVSHSADVPRVQRLVAWAMLRGWALLYRRGMMDYLLVRAVATGWPTY
jgi:erythromycin 3''-O-methyltransferase